MVMSSGANATVQPVSLEPMHLQMKTPPLKTLNTFGHSRMKLSRIDDSPPIFDIPMTYNARVKYWIRYFQTGGRKWFKVWLERSPRYMPKMQSELRRAGLPQDLAFIAMIESGFSTSAHSHASAVGPWQFIETTGTRYGLHTSWWLDERRDVDKSTVAAVHYLKDLYRIFQSWYLVAASYNTGENRIKRMIQKYNTHDFWTLARQGAFSEETINYVPKLLAATLIAKAPALYGFRDIQPMTPLNYDYFEVPGGTDMAHMADFMGVTRDHLLELNPELLQGVVPPHIHSHRIRIPKGATSSVARFVRRTMSAQN